jgi:protein-tyrosine phosphatase
MNVLMVCLGNICRSPLAEGILRHQAAAKGLDWVVDSAGTGDWHVGQLPDPRSIATARKRGIDIAYQRARQIGSADFYRFDHILVMDNNNRAHVLSLAPEASLQSKVSLIMDASHPGGSMDVPDPYWDDNGFDPVFDMLETACSAFIAKYAI